MLVCIDCGRDDEDGISTLILGLMPASLQRCWKRAFGRAPPPRKTGSSGCGLSGMMLLLGQEPVQCGPALGRLDELAELDLALETLEEPLGPLDRGGGLSQLNGDALASRAGPPTAPHWW